MMLPLPSRLPPALFLLLLTFTGCDLLGDAERVRSPDGPLLPLATGNEWIFRSEETAPAGTTRIVGSGLFGGQRYYVAEGPGIADTLRRDDQDRIYRIQNGTEQLWLDPTSSDGESYVIDTFHFQGETYERRVTVEHEVGVETHATTFSNGVQFRIDVPGIADDTRWITLVPGVGPVRSRTSWVGPILLEAFRLNAP